MFETIFIVGAILAIVFCKDECNQKKRKMLYKKYDNMTTYELDRYIKENGISEYFEDGYGRETKIQKLIDRKMNY
jgi:Na+-translocating ferredoxin:NAD+ oxidoreductase RnfC subunit